MISTDDNSNRYDDRIRQIEQLRDKNKIDEAIFECSNAVEWALKNGDILKELQARNMLASLYWKKNDLKETLSQYSIVISKSVEHNQRYTDENIHALFHAVVILTRIQPPPPQLFSLANELVEVRSKMVNGDENDKELQEYKMILESLKRTYRRRHHLRKPQKYVYTEIVGIANNDETSSKEQ